MELGTGRARRGGAACSAVAIVLMTLVTVASAQERTLNRREFGAQDGLPAVTINALARDASGYLWLGTTGGLIRFDGVQFTTWGAQGEPALPSQRIEAILPARDGSLWIGFCASGGITRISQQQILTFDARHGLACVRALFQDRDGTIWAGARAGVARLRGNRWEYIRGPQGLPAVSAFTFLEDRSRRLWVATAAGVYRRIGSSDRFERVSPAVVHGLSEDWTGRVWTTDAVHGYRLVESEPGTRGTAPPAIEGINLFHDRRGRLWVGSRSHGLLRTHASGELRIGATGSRVAREVPEGAAWWTFLEDDEGSLWVGSSGRLIRFFESDIDVVMRFSEVQSGRDGFPPVIEAGSDGVLWIGTADGLLTASAIGGFRARPVFQGRYITALHEGGGRLWIGTSEGVGTLEGGRFSPVDRGPADSVLAMATDARGDLWVCYDYESAPYRRHDGRFARVDIGSDLGKACSTLYNDRSGRIWIGFGDGSIGMHDGDRLRIYPEDPSARGAVCVFTQTGDGTIWAGTGGGLSRLDGGVFTVMTRANGSPGRAVGALVGDAGGDLWAAFDTGIARFGRADLDAARSNPHRRPPYAFYDVSDGLVDVPNCRSHPAAVRGADGRLWFISRSAVAAIDPARPAPRVPPFAMRVERVLADQEPVDAVQQAVLPARTDRLQVGYSAATLTAASKVRYRFKLEGFDRDWVDAGVRRQTFYTGLAPGAYRFVVSADVNGVQHSAAGWSFRIQPLFYQTWWFYGLCAGALALAISGAWRARLWMLKRQYARVLDERARIARVLHDTVLQNVAGMALKLEGIALDAPEQVARDLRQVRSLMEHEIGEARRSIQELRTVTLETQTLPVALRAFAEGAAVGGATELDMVVAGDVRRCPPDVEEEILRIGQEAISNAIRHSGARHLRTELAYAPDSVRLTVSDDGCGFSHDPAFAGAHWGMRGMHERARRVGGKVSVTTRPNAGTEIEARIPVPMER